MEVSGDSDLASYRDPEVLNNSLTIDQISGDITIATTMDNPKLADKLDFYILVSLEYIAA